MSSGSDLNPTAEKLAVIKNCRRVTDWLYRSGQPEVDQIPILKEAGIKTIICLRWTTSAIVETRIAAKRNDLNFICMPLTYWAFPTRKEIDKFFSIIDDESMRPVFVHCFHGSDRTGLLMAFYRMAREGWTADQAYEEMVECGFHRIRMRHFKWAVYAFEQRLKRAQRRISK